MLLGVRPWEGRSQESGVRSQEGGLSNRSARLTRLLSPVSIRMPSPASPDQDWTPLRTPDRFPSASSGPEEYFSSGDASANAPPHTTRKPTLLLVLSGVFLLRFADRQFSGLLFQEPPRSRGGCPVFTVSKIRDRQIAVYEAARYLHGRGGRASFEWTDPTL